MRLFQKIIFLPAFLIVLLCFGTFAYGVVLNNDSAGSLNTIGQNNQVITVSKEPEHASNEVIVKLKHKESPKMLYSMSYSQRSSMDTAILDNLKTKYRLTDERPVFKILHDRLKSANISQMQLDAKNSIKISNRLQLSSVPEQANQTVDLLPIYVLRTDENPQEISNKLKQDSGIEYAEPNYIRKVQIIPNDPYYSSRGSWGQSYDDLWGIKRIRCDMAWDISQGEGVVVAVIDTGADYNHPDLWDNVWVNPAIVPDRNHDGKIDLSDCDLNGDHIIEPSEIVDNMFGWNFVSNGNNPMDDHGHGTHTSGTIAATGNNGIGVIGVSPRAKIMILKGLDQDGSGNDWTLAQCITYAADNGAKVLSNSWGGPGRSGLLADVFHYAYSKGCVAVAAAGNSSADDSDFTPANIDTVIAVAAVDPYDNLASFSNYGMNVCVSAPGVDILSLRANGTDMYKDGIHIVADRYYRSNGTSMACPHVAGLAALIASRYPQYNNDQIKWLIKNSVDIAPVDEPIFPPGFGVINTLSSLLNPTIPPRLHVTIDVGQVNYNLDNTSISYDVEGEDLWQYTIQYKKVEEPDWHNLVGPSNTPGQSQYIWDLSNVSDGAYTIFLSAMTSDGRKETVYASLNIDRVSYYQIYPENIFITHYIDSNNGSGAEGLYRRGDQVPLIGRTVGEYHLEWRKDIDGSQWSTDFMKNESSGGRLAIWDTSSIAEDGLYLVKIVDQLGAERYTSIRLDGKVKQGFPIILSPFDADGVIDGSSFGTRFSNNSGSSISKMITLRNYFKFAHIYVFNANGISEKDWEINGEYGNSAFSALADIDGDGRDEILMTTACPTASSSYSENLYCYKNDGTLVFEKVIPPSNDSFRAVYMRDPAILTDVNGDGMQEIIYRHDNALYLMDKSGNDFSEAWPKPLEAGYPMVIGDTDYMAVGNFDEDPDFEIVIVQNEGYIDRVQNGHLNIHVFNIDGTYVAGWPKIIDNCYSVDSVRCGDIDGDGYDEIVLIATSKDINGVESKSIYCFNRQGTELFKKDMGHAYISDSILADINGDGACEFIVGNICEIDAIDKDGHSLVGWPFVYSNQNDILIPRLAVDIDNDGEVEIIAQRIQHAGGADGNMYSNHLLILSPSGQIKAFNPLNDAIMPPSINGVHYTDMDGDGFGELVIEGSLPVWYEGNHLYWNYKPCILVYKTDASFNPCLAQWPTPHHDKNNTNRWNKIKGLNHVPVLDPIGNKIVDEDKLLEFGVNATDPDGDPLTYSATNLPSGAVFDPVTKTFTWTPTYDQAGTYNVIFTVSDGSLTASEAVTITVNDVNRPPVFDLSSQSPLGQIQLAGGYRITQEDVASFQVKVTDPENDAITVSLENAPSFVTVVTYPQYQGVWWLNVVPPFGSYGTYDNVKILAYDKYHKDSPAIFTFKIIVGRRPFISATGQPTGRVRTYETITGNTNQTLSFDIAASSPDNLKIVSWEVFTNPVGSTITAVSDTVRHFTWTPTKDQTGQSTVNIRVRDSSGTVAMLYLTLDIKYINRPPMLNPIDNKTVDENKPLRFTISGSDPDGDKLAYSAANLPQGATFNSATGIFTWTPTYYQAGSYKVTFTVSDGTLSASQTIAITVNNVNGPPVIDPIGNKTVQYNHLLQFKITAHDPDKSDNLHLRFYSDNLPPGAYLSQTGTFVWVPAKRQEGVYSIHFYVKDSHGLTDSKIVTIIVK
jgi:subtilisin family serine protease/PKD repeat protein